MRRDVRTNWTVRDDVRAKLQSSIKRLLVKNGYPPRQAIEAIRLGDGPVGVGGAAVCGGTSMNRQGVITNRDRYDI